MDSIQAIVNKLAGTQGLTVQEALSYHFGYTGLPYSEQEIFNIKRGANPTNGNSVQESLWSNLKDTLSLTRPANEYSEQDLWNKAFSAGLTLDVIVSGQSLQDYIKSLSGLVAYYPMDEASGNMINQAPNTLGTLDGTVTGATQNVDGSNGKAYSFDGTGDYVTMPTIELSGSHTFGLMIKADTFSYPGNASAGSQIAGLLVKGFWAGDGTGDTRLVVRTVGNVLQFQITTSTGAVSSPTAQYATSNLSTGTWYLVVGVCDIENSLVKLYVNDVKVNEAAIAGTFSNNTRAITIASYTNNLANNEFAGDIQHSFIVNRALTDQEISNISSFFF